MSNTINENCKNPYNFLNDSICSTPEFKDYIDGYKSYITNMSEYCGKNDNIISNSYCNNFVENNKFIQNTDIQTNLKKNIPDLCKANIKDDLNKICINGYSIKPDIVIEKEELARQEELAIQKKADAKNTNIYIGVGVILFICGSGFTLWKKNQKNKKNQNI